MGLFTFIAEKKKQKEELRQQEEVTEQLREKAAQELAELELEKSKALEIEQAKNRAAYDIISAGDADRFKLGSRWMLDNVKPILKAAITKIGSESGDNYYSTPYGIEVYDQIDFTDSFDFDSNGNDKSRIIASFENSEIGELSKATREKLEDYDIDNLIGIVSKVSDDDDLKISVAIYEGADFSEPGYRQLHSSIAGTKYNNEDGSSRQEHLSHLFRGERIKLTCSEYNGAPAVIASTARDFQVGFLKAELADEMCKRLNRNQIGGVYVIKIVENDGIKYCDIVINIANF